MLLISMDLIVYDDNVFRDCRNSVVGTIFFNHFSVFVEDSPTIYQQNIFPRFTNKLF